MTNVSNARFVAKLLRAAAPLALIVGFTSPGVAQNLPGTMGAHSGVSTPTTSGSTMNVAVTAPRAYAEWDTFDVANGYTFNVTDNQSGAYIFVNRVTGGTQSDIFGSIAAQGHIWLLNPNGIVVGNGAVIDVGGLLLSTATHLNTEDDTTNGAEFLNPTLGAFFNNNFRLGGAAGAITIQPGAQLIADIGAISLISNAINFSGTANTRAGEIALVGAQDVLFGMETDTSVHFDANLNAFTELRILQGSNQGTAVTVSNSGASVFNSQRTVIAAAGMIDGQGNILLNNGGGANSVTFQDGDVVLYAARNTNMSRQVLSGDNVQNIGAYDADEASISVQGLLDAPGSLKIHAAGGTGEGNRDLALRSANTLFIENEARGLDVAIQTTGGNIDVDSVSAQDDIVIRTPGTATFGALVSGATVDGVGASDTGAIADGLAGASLTGFDIDVVANGITAGGLQTGAASTSNIRLNGGTGNVAVSGAVTLSAGSSNFVSGNGNVSFSGTIDGGGDLTINAPGLTTFSGAIGATTALAGLATDAAGSTSLNGTVRTTGAQTFGDAVALGGVTTLTSTGGGAITFDSTVDGGRALTVNTAGVTTFNGNVGGTTALTSLTTNVGGITVLNGNVATSGAQAYGDSVTLAGNLVAGSASFTGALALSDGIHTISAFSTTFQAIDSVNPGMAGLVINNSGTANLNGAVGAISALQSLNLSGNATLGGAITTTGAQSYNGTVMMQGSSGTFTSSAGGDISFANTLNGARAIAVNTSGTTTFGGSIGSATAGSSPLSITTDAVGTTRIGGQVWTSGAMFFGDAVEMTTGNGWFLSHSDGAITFGSTVDGASALSINTGGITTFTGAVGSIAPLVNVATNSTGSTRILGGSIKATGMVSFADSVILGAHTTVTGNSGGNFSGGLTGGGYDLTLNFASGGAINGANFTGLRNLTVENVGTTQLSGTLTTSGTQTYNNAVTLTGDAILVSTGAGANGNISLGAVTGNGNSLTVQALNGATASFNGVASGVNLLTVDAGIVDINAALSASSIDLAAATGAIDVGANLTATGSAMLQAAAAISGSGTIGGAQVSLSGNGVGTSGSRINTAAGTLAAYGGSGGVYISEANGVTLAAIGSVGNGAGDRYDLTAGGNITVANGVSVAGGDLVIAATAGDISLSTTDSDLAAGGGGAIRLTASGTIGSAAADTTLTAADIAMTAAHWIGGIFNDATLLETGDVTITDTAGGLSIAGGVSAAGALSVDVQGSGALIVGGALQASENISLSAGALILEAHIVTSRALTLNASGTIGQTGGSITANTLSGSAGDVIALNSAANDIDELGAFSSGGFHYRDLNGFTVAGDITGTTGVRLNAASGDIILAGNINAAGSTVDLTASTGGVTQTGGIVTADTLTGSVGSNASLTRANQITNLGSFLANSLSLSDVGGITITDAVQTNLAGGDLIIRTTGGALTIAAAGSLTGRNVALSTDAAFVNNAAGNAIATSGAGHWVVYAAAPTGNSYGGLNSNNRAIWNGTIDTVAPGSVGGNRYVFAYRPTVTLTTLDVTKVYGTDITSLAGTLYAVSGLQSGVAGAFLGDTAATAFSGAPVITSDGFAERAPVAGGAYAVNIATGTLAGINGYAVAVAGGGQVAVRPKELTSNAAANNKIYDGNANATGSIALDGILSGDEVTATGTFTFADKNAGEDKVVTATGVALSGEHAGNYAVANTATTQADIEKKAITATGSANNKTYDGTTNATGGLALEGVVNGDDVDATGTFAFADKNAGIGKNVNVNGLSLTGADAGNYTVTLQGSTTANIARKQIDGTVAVAGKTYDGTTAANGSITLSGVEANDQVSASAQFVFSDKNASQDKLVTITGAVLSGTDAGNYTLAIPATVVADILRKEISGTVAANDKVYDGTSNTTGSVLLSGALAGDDVAASAVFAFGDRNAGAAKTVVVTDGALSGTDAGNYVLTVPASTVAAILQRAITVTANNGSKTEGSADPAFTYAVTSGSLVTGETLSGNLARAQGEAPGDYAIQQGTLAASSNYRLTFIGATLNIKALLETNPIPAVSVREDHAGFLAHLVSLNMSAEGEPLEVSDERDACKTLNEEDVCSSTGS
jgi:filamentous hemagglutinin family protein